MLGDSFNRRDALKAIAGFLGGAAAAACGSDDAGSQPDGAAAPPDAMPPAPDAEPPPRIDAMPERCPDSQLTAAELLAPIDTFVVLCMENRSFDHYFGALSLVEGRTDVDGLTGSETNPDPDGNPVGVHLLENFTPADPPHTWDECHRQWNGGANDGFVTEHAGPSQADVMGYHVRDQIPVLYALADQGALCDAWYCSLLGPTWPNRYYLHGATSEGMKTNFLAGGFTSIFSVLSDAGISHKNYFHDLAWASGGYLKFDNDTIETFFDDAASGNLPQLSIIDPQFLGAGANDDHPSHDIRLGQILIGAVVNAVAQSPQWNRSLVIVTYDEHGGFYDHVPPPTTYDERADFQQLGFRVPSVVVGPHVKRGCAVHTAFEHSSVISTLTARYGLAPMNDRVTVTPDLSPCIDERYLTDPQSPPVIPAVEMPKNDWRRRPAAARGVHEEMVAALRARPLPPGQDRRADADGITERVLARAEALGAVRYTD